MRAARFYACFKPVQCNECIDGCQWLHGAYILAYSRSLSCKLISRYKLCQQLFIRHLPYKTKDALCCAFCKTTQVWTAPLEAAAIIGLLLWRTGGVYGLPALGVVLVVLPLQYYFGYKIAQHKAANVEVSDARVLRMHEVLLAIKLVKFYVWEKSFARQVKDVSGINSSCCTTQAAWQ